jgi:hypothetical protein
MATDIDDAEPRRARRLEAPPLACLGEGGGALRLEGDHEHLEPLGRRHLAELQKRTVIGVPSDHVAILAGYPRWLGLESNLRRGRIEEWGPSGQTQPTTDEVDEKGALCGQIVLRSADEVR